MNEKQDALAAEIRAEMARRSPRLTATQMQQRTGIKHASWRNWFVTASRPVPYPELEKVADALGVPLAELLRRAEVRAAQAPPADPIRDELESKLTKRGRRQVERAREEFEAGEGGVDPQGRARVDEDDGRSGEARIA